MNGRPPEALPGVRASASVFALVLAVAVGLSVAGSAAGSDPVPDTEIVSADTGPREILTRKGKAIFRYRSDLTGVGFECSLDAGSWRGCGRGSFRRSFGPGRHRFEVRAVGGSGAVDPTPAVHEWRVRRWEPKVAAAARYASRRAGGVSFSLDLGWRSWGRNSGTRVRMASTVKVMLMVAYLRKRPVRDRKLNGFERATLSAMIRVSDNGAATTIASRVGSARMISLARRAGMKDFSYSTAWGLSKTSARDQASFMRDIERLLPDRHRGFALGLLSRISPLQRWGVSKVKPPGWKLFFKGGWGMTGLEVNNQVALLERGRYRIGLAVLTRNGPSLGYGQETLRKVAGKLLAGLPTP